MCTATMPGAKRNTGSLTVAPHSVGEVIWKSAFKNCQSGSSYTRSLVGTSTVTSFNSLGPSLETCAGKLISGGSPGLAAVVPRLTVIFTSPTSASEWLTTPNWAIRCPLLLSVTRKPTNSMYLAIGLEVLLAVKCAGTAGASLVCLLADVEEEQPIRNIARKSQPSRIEFMMPYCVVK